MWPILIMGREVVRSAVMDEQGFRVVPGSAVDEALTVMARAAWGRPGSDVAAAAAAMSAAMQVVDPRDDGHMLALGARTCALGRGVVAPPEGDAAFRAAWFGGVARR